LPQGIIEEVPLILKERAKKELKLSGPVYLMIGNFVPDHGPDIILNQADKIGGTILIKTDPNINHGKRKQFVLDYLDKNQKLVILETSSTTGKASATILQMMEANMPSIVRRV
jgi:hypothetical protein